MFSRQNLRYHIEERHFERLFGGKFVVKRICTYLCDLTAKTAFFCFVLAIAFSGCVFQARKNNFPAQQTKSSASREENKEEKREEDEGDFLLKYESARRPEFIEYERKLRDDKTLEKALDRLNHSLSLPQDVTIKIKECGQANSFYDSAEKQVVLCFEMIHYFYELFRREGYDKKRAEEKAFDAMKFVFLHEIGHALIDVYKLPVTGNEEDAVDRLSSIICLEKLGDEGLHSVLAAADAFKIEARHKPFKNRRDEHLLQEERAFVSLCMIYGSDPDKYSYIAKKYLPADRIQSCLSEYERILRSWSALLEKWRKD